MAIAASNFITTTTRERFFPKVVNNIFTGNRLWNRLRASARPWTGGHRMTQSTTVVDRASAKSFSGFDALDTDQKDVRKMFVEDPSEYSNQVVFSGIQMAVNKGPEAFVNAMASEFTDVGRNLGEKLGADTYLDGTGNGGKAITGLNALVDDGTDIVTIQGLSRTTYPVLNSTRNAQAGALGFDDLATDVDAAQRGNDSPTVMMTTPAVFSIIERLTTPTLQINYQQSLPTGSPTGGSAGVSLSTGANAQYFRGIPILSDEMCPAQNLWTLNENHLFLYNLAKAPESVVASKEGFGWSGWRKGSNQDAIVGWLLWTGQLVTESSRTMARRTAIAT